MDTNLYECILENDNENNIDNNENNNTVNNSNQLKIVLFFFIAFITVLTLFTFCKTYNGVTHENAKSVSVVSSEENKINSTDIIVTSDMLDDVEYNSIYETLNCNNVKDLQYVVIKYTKYYNVSGNLWFSNYPDKPFCYN